MKLISRLSMLVTAAALIVIANSSLSAENVGEKNLKMFEKKAVPAAVSAAFLKAYPKAKIKGADREVKDGKAFYEIESIDGKFERNLLYTPEGEVYEIEQGIGVNNLPAIVKTSAEKEFAKCKIEKSERITRGETVEYELLISSGGKKIELVIDASGHIVRSTNLTKGDEEDDDDESNEQED